MRNFLYRFGLAVLTCFSSVSADDSMSKDKVQARDDMDEDWTIELGSGVHFGNVRTTGLDSYTTVPVHITASLLVDEISLDDFWSGVFRGNTEFLFRGIGTAIPKGVERRIIGLSLGPRYNFVQKGWVVVPFVEGVVGFAFADSRGYNDSAGNNIGFGQDFNFQFGVAGGIRYDFCEDWFLRLSGVYTHFSNAGLSDPGRKNRAMDQAGPELALGCRF